MKAFDSFMLFLSKYRFVLHFDQSLEQIQVQAFILIDKIGSFHWYSLSRARAEGSYPQLLNCV